LHEYYTRFETYKKEKNIEWNPIDQDIYLPYHYQLNRVPCTFEPTGIKYKIMNTFLKLNNNLIIL
jgi:hypothetical protein